MGRVFVTLQRYVFSSKSQLTYAELGVSIGVCDLTKVCIF